MHPRLARGDVTPYEGSAARDGGHRHPEALGQRGHHDQARAGQLQPSRAAAAAAAERVPGRRDAQDPERLGVVHDHRPPGGRHGGQIAADGRHLPATRAEAIGQNNGMTLPGWPGPGAAGRFLRSYRAPQRAGVVVAEGPHHSTAAPGALGPPPGDGVRASIDMDVPGAEGGEQVPERVQR